MDKFENARSAVIECLGRDSDGSLGHTHIFRAGTFNSFAHARYVLAVVGFFSRQQNVTTEKIGTLSVKVADSTMSPTDLVELANTDPAAWDACFSLMPHWGRLSDAMLSFNQRFIAGEIKRPGGKGKAIKSHDFRDLRIALAVHAARCEGLPIYATSNKASAMTACELVAQETKLDADTVKRIWTKFPKHFRG